MRCLRNVVTASAAGCLALIYSEAAFAISAGCAAVNAGFTVSSPSGAELKVGSFDVGDTITFTATNANGVPQGLRIIFASPANVSLKDEFFPIPANGSATVSSTAPAGAGRAIIGFNAGGITTNLSGSATCTPAASGGSTTPSTSSQLLDETRQRFSKAAAQVSITNVGESVTGAISDAFAGGGGTQFSEGRIATSFAAIDKATDKDDKANPNDAYAALGYDKGMARKAPPLPNIAPSPWHAWIDVRYTALDSKQVSTFDAHHTNATGGLSYRFNDHFLAGLVAGYEDFNYELGFRNAKLDGNGWNGGGYFGWKFLDRLRLDGMLTYGRISYGAQADNVTAGFDADRITGMLRLSGRWGLGASFYVEPSARIIYANEKQDAFTDTAGVLHSKYDFDVGLASFGGEVGAATIWNSWVVTPTVGLYSDYRIGADTAATIATLPNFGNGMSARVTGGLRWTASNGFTTSVGGEYGGLGSDIQFWRARASAGMAF